MATPDLLAREAEFEERRRRVLRGMGVLALAALGGIGLVAAARAFAPDAFEASVAVFLAAAAAAGLALWRTLRRHWRCPACAVRWESGDALASTQWNHCPTCGAALRATPKQTAHERIALTEFALEDPSRDELVARFRRRRRRGGLAAAAAVAAGVAALLWVQQRGWGELAEQAVLALFAGLVIAAAVTSARCPRCRVGILAGKGRRCQRCGLTLQPGPGAPADRGS